MECVHRELKKEQGKRKPERIVALDVLRGFDMFWITGGLPLVMAFLALFWKPLPEGVAYHLTHVQWEGFAAWDLVMPLFLFVVGAALPFSLEKKKGLGSKGKLYSQIFTRTLVLWLFGMMVQGNLLTFKPEHFVLLSNTLQAIAGGYLVCALLVLHTTARTRLWVLGGLLLLYGALLWAVADPVTGKHWEPNANLATWVERSVLGGWAERGDYAWVLPQLGFVASVLFGVFAGSLLQKQATFGRKFGELLVWGLALLILGGLASLWIPVIKKIWTPSMVLWSSGWCFLLLALFYLICDGWGWQKLFFPFKVIGSNAIFAYMWVSLCSPQGNISRVLFGGFSGLFGEGEHFVFLLCNYGLVWGVLYFFYKNKLFLKV